jgi:hypothetical protein
MADANKANIEDLKDGEYQEAGQDNMPVVQQYEVAAFTMAAQAKAMVSARYELALRRPRNWDQVRQELLKECERPAFALNKSTYYVKPIGDGVEGLGIRFVEAALSNMTNCLVEDMLLYEDETKQIIRVTVSDLERNTSYWHDFPVERTVERSRPTDDGTYVSKRRNSKGKWVFLVPGNEDDITMKRNALISKAIRTIGLRLLPVKLKEDCVATIMKVREADVKKDPDEAKNRILDSFNIELNVAAADLTAFLGHSVDTASPAELSMLRGIFGAIRDGESTWVQMVANRADVMQKYLGAAKNAPPPVPPANGTPTATAGGKPPTQTVAPQGIAPPTDQVPGPTVQTGGTAPVQQAMQDQAKTDATPATERKDPPKQRRNFNLE